MIKKSIFPTVVLFIISFNRIAFSQIISKNEKLATLCKSWGALKYYHPLVVRGDYDWDKVLFSKIDALDTIEDQFELNQFYSKWTAELSIYKIQKKDIALLPEQKVIYTQFAKDSALFGNEFIHELHELFLSKRSQNKMFYAMSYPAGQFAAKNEKPYPEMDYSNENYRLLALFRYWNIIRYFYPIMEDIDWNAVLNKYIPIFRNSNDQIEYYLALKQLVAEIKDGHAYLQIPNPKILSDYFYKYQIPCVTKRFENFALVTQLDKGNFEHILQVGDTIIAVDEIPINTILERVKMYVSVSNHDNLLEYAHPLTFSGNTEQFTATIVRNKDTLNVKVKRYLIEDFQFDPPLKSESMKIINDSVVYINPIDLTKKQLKTLLKKAKSYENVIIDMRGYPLIRNTVFTNFISPKRKVFIKMKAPYLPKPGTFYTFKNTTGRKNKHFFKGKIIVLVNKYTKSASEYTCIAMQAYDNVKIVGTTTSGSDGNVSIVVFPGNVKTCFSGLHCFYPNGVSSQHHGIQIDYKVNITPLDALSGKDIILNYAINWINSAHKCKSKE